MKTTTDRLYSNNTPCVVALGCFDGVHLGHAAVISAAVNAAKEYALPCCIWSFSEPPKRFYDPNCAPLLTDAKEKERIIESLGVDIFISVKFDEYIAALSPEVFFEQYLVKQLKAKHIFCGFDFTFGKGGAGNAELLKQLSAQRGIRFTEIGSVELDGNSVSSSTVRNLLMDGKPEEAAKYLGRPYSITAQVIDGQHLGRSLGFPTINQTISKGLCIPAFGVYLTKIYFDGIWRFGITNVGTRPTVDGHHIVCETNIFDYSGNLYGKEIRVEFLSFVRPEKKFSSVSELSEQVHADIETAKNLINK